MTEISVKTGDESSAGSDAVADLKICDGLGNCCQTLGLDNHGNDREKGQIDVYSGYLLSNCSQVRVSLPFDVVLPLFSFQHTFDPSGRWTVHLNLEDNAYDAVSANAWYVDWVRISTEDSDLKKQFICSIGAWLGGNMNYTIASNCQEILQRARRDDQVL